MYNFMIITDVNASFLEQDLHHALTWYCQVQSCIHFRSVCAYMNLLMFVKYFLLTTSFPSTPNMCVRFKYKLDKLSSHHEHHLLSSTTISLCSEGILLRYQDIINTSVTSSILFINLTHIFRKSDAFL